MEKEKTCCITGHRELTPEQGAIAVVKLMTELLQAGQDGYTTVITGMAKGVDLIAAEDVLLIKNNTNIYLKEDTERRGFFVSGKEDAAGNTVCIPKAADAAWREKDRREWLVLIRY